MICTVLLKNDWNILYEIFFYKHIFFHAGYFSMLLLSFADFFINILLFEEFFQEQISECQTVRIQIRMDIHSVLIWFQTVFFLPRRKMKVLIRTSF